MNSATIPAIRQDDAPRGTGPQKRPRVQFSLGSLLWLMGGSAVVLGLTIGAELNGFVVSVSLLLVTFLWSTAPRSTSFQKFLVMLFSWSGGLVGWCVLEAMDFSNRIRFLGWSGEAEVMSFVGSASLAMSIAAYLILYKRSPDSTRDPADGTGDSV